MQEPEATLGRRPLPAIVGRARSDSEHNARSTDARLPVGSGPDAERSISDVEQAGATPGDTPDDLTIAWLPGSVGTY